MTLGVKLQAVSFFFFKGSQVIPTGSQGLEQRARAASPCSGGSRTPLFPPTFIQVLPIHERPCLHSST